MSTSSSIRTLAGSLLAAALFGQAPAGAPAPQPPAREPGLYATIQTSLGAITLRLFEKEAPITVRNFADLAMGRKEFTDPRTGQKVKKPLYNGLTFHRVIPGFMIQGGDPLGTGTGGTAPIKDEFVPALKFDKPGILGMANAGPGTGSCQFFITVVPTPHLNGKHTVFGEVIEGQGVVEKIATVPTDAGNKPRTPVRMISVTIKREGPPPAPAAKPAAAKPAAPKPAAAKPAAKTAAPVKK